MMKDKKYDNLFPKTDYNEKNEKIAEEDMKKAWEKDTFKGLKDLKDLNFTNAFNRKENFED